MVEDWGRHGNVRAYLRRPGKPKLRLREEPGTPEFEAEYRGALEGRIKPTPERLRMPDSGSLRALCVAYFASAEPKRMEPRSRHVGRSTLDKLCDEYGDKPAGRMEARHVRQVRDARSDALEATNGIVKALRAVYRNGVLADLVSKNPARDVEHLRSGSEGLHTWTAAEVQLFEAHHPIGTNARLALALLLYTGQRRSDLVRLGPQHLRDGWLRFTQYKNRNRKLVSLSLPLVPKLQRVIDRTPRGALAFLVTERGTPYTNDGFGSSFGAWCRQAGLSHRSAGTWAAERRGSPARRLAELGASIHEIAAVTPFAEGSATLHAGRGTRTHEKSHSGAANAGVGQKRGATH